MGDTIIQFWDNKKNKAVAVTPDTPLPISGGTPPNNSIGPDQLEDGAVTTPKIADGAVTVDKIADSSVTADKITDKAVTQAKLADDLVGFIQEHKITVLNGHQDANKLVNPGVYIDAGGYGLSNAPRDNYGWMLISSLGSSNGHNRGAQLYVDYNGIDWRGLDGSKFTDWETCIVKNKITDLEPIGDTSTATPEEVATAYNALLAAMKG